MAQWGRNDQSVTVTTSTTHETSNGAPIGTYALVKAGGGNYAHQGNTHGTRANADLTMYANTTADAFIPGKTVGVFGVDPSEVSYARDNNEARPAHAGWVLRTEGAGGRAGRVQYETLVAMGSLGQTDDKYGTPAETLDGDGSILPPDNTPV